jgi:Domain of unknown function (DUF4136)
MITHRLFGATVVVAGAALAVACAPTIRSERDENIPVPQGATWAWAGATTAAHDTAARDRYIPNRFAAGSTDPIVQQRFRRAIGAAMLARGFRKADDSSQADFLVSFSLDGTDAYRRPVVATTAVGFGFYGGGFGYRPWGFGRPFGFYRPWGYYPWGWSFGFAGYPAYPAYGYASSAYPYGTNYYRDGWLVVELRLRSDGEVAWIGRYRTEEHEARQMPQAKVQEVVNKLFGSLR